MPNSSTQPVIQSLNADAYIIPTDSPESDGTLQWDHTDMVVVHLSAGNEKGFGWTYAPAAAADLIHNLLKASIVGWPAMDIPAIWTRMRHAIRNADTRGLCSMAISAVDIALWDLKARLMNLPLVDLLGKAGDGVDIYGSGGFTSYDERQLTDQLSGWASIGIPRVKMKVGRDPEADPRRVATARRAVGDKTMLFVDANGAYARKQALAMAERFVKEQQVCWFEEPRPSSDLSGLRMLRDRAPAGMDIAAGEYGDVPRYFLDMLQAGAVDCLQADATRCGGCTGFLKAAALCDAFEMPLSAHCAPQIHAHLGCAAPSVRHVEYFHDHVRIDRLLLDGALEPRQGRLCPDPRRLGHGLIFKASDAEQYRQE